MQRSADQLENTEISLLLRGARRSYQVARFETARELCQIAVTYYPESADAHYLLGEIANHQRKYKTAASHFEAALKADTANSTFWVSFIQSLIIGGQLQSVMTVVALFSQMIFEKPFGSGRADLMSTLFKEGLAKHRAGNLNEAEMLYESMLMLDDKYGDALHLAGVIAYQRGDYSEAAGLLRLAIERGEAKSLYHGDLGGALIALGELDAASVHLRRAIQLSPSDEHAEICLNYANGKLASSRPFNSRKFGEEVSSEKGSSPPSIAALLVETLARAAR